MSSAAVLTDALRVKGNYLFYTEFIKVLPLNPNFSIIKDTYFHKDCFPGIKWVKYCEKNSTEHCVSPVFVTSQVKQIKKMMPEKQYLCLKKLFWDLLFKTNDIVS